MTKEESKLILKCIDELESKGFIISSRYGNAKQTKEKLRKVIE